LRIGLRWGRGGIGGRLGRWCPRDWFVMRRRGGRGSGVCICLSVDVPVLASRFPGHVIRLILDESMCACGIQGRVVAVAEDEETETYLCDPRAQIRAKQELESLELGLYHDERKVARRIHVPSHLFDERDLLSTDQSLVQLSSFNPVVLFRSSPLRRWPLSVPSLTPDPASASSQLKSSFLSTLLTSMTCPYEKGETSVPASSIAPSPVPPAGRGKATTRAPCAQPPMHVSELEDRVRGVAARRRRLRRGCRRCPPCYSQGWVKDGGSLVGWLRGPGLRV